MKIYGIMEYGGPEVLQSIETDKPTPGPDQILIRVQATSINNADLLTRKGAFHAAGGKFPIVPGLDVTGIVEETGNNVTGLPIGQRVLGFPNNGSYADYVVLDKALAFPIPDSLSVEQAAACGLVSFTAHKLIAECGRLQKGESVLIHGIAGSVGNMSLQIARDLGASKVIGTVVSEEQKNAAEDAGADLVINVKEQDFAAVVNQYTDQGGVDVILDPFGDTVTEMSLQCLAPYGRLVIFGSAGKYFDVDTGLLHPTCRSIIGFSIASTRKMRPERLRPSADYILPRMADGRLNVTIAASYPMTEAASAHALMEKGNCIGKIILKGEI